jgi:hypothetical protein
VVYAYFIAAIESVSQNVPTFVYLIISIYFILFMVFAVNMVLQYKKVGPWRDYLYGERAYILLSLTAKALLAWQVSSQYSCQLSPREYVTNIPTSGLTVAIPPLYRRKGRRVRRRNKVILAITVPILVSLAGFVVWAETPLGPMPEAHTALQSDSSVDVRMGKWLVSVLFILAKVRPLSSILGEGWIPSRSRLLLSLHPFFGYGISTAVIGMNLNLHTSLSGCFSSELW